jgi:hypothetical protein
MKTVAIAQISVLGYPLASPHFSTERPGWVFR